MSTYVGHITIRSKEAWRSVWDHIDYLQKRKGVDLEPNGSRPIFDKTQNSISCSEAIDKVQPKLTSDIEHIYVQLLLAPNTNTDDLLKYTRFVLSGLDVYSLDWFAVVHKTGKHPHVHVVVAPKFQRSQKALFSWEMIYELRMHSNYYLFCLDDEERMAIS